MDISRKGVLVLLGAAGGYAAVLVVAIAALGCVLRTGAIQLHHELDLDYEIETYSQRLPLVDGGHGDACSNWAARGLAEGHIPAFRFGLPAFLTDGCASDASDHGESAPHVLCESFGVDGI